MNLFANIRTLVIESLEALVADGVLPADLNMDNVTVEPPRDAAHGDMATNAAMVLAKPAKMKPRDIAEALATKLQDDNRITAAEVAGPGFLNLRLADWVLAGLGQQDIRWWLRPVDHGHWYAGERSNMSAQTQPDHCTWATYGVRSLAMRWPACWPTRATT